MQPIRMLSGLEYIRIRNEAAELIEQLQNHHIARIMDGSRNLGQFSDSQANELFLRAMKVGLTNGTNIPNIQYSINKMQDAIEYLEQE